MRIGTFDWVSFGALAVASIVLVAVVAGIVRAGPLDPADAPASTMRSLADIPRAWRANLSTVGDDACQTERFQCVLGDAAVLDQETGLVWERTPDTGALVTWTGAIAACIGRTTGNRGGWRLPTLAEMRTLIAVGQSTPALPVNHPFSVASIASDGVWTTTSRADDVTSAWLVVLSNGAPGTVPKTSAGLRYWCVRGADPAEPR